MENEITITIKELIACTLAMPFYYLSYKLIFKLIDFVWDLIKKKIDQKKEVIKENV